MEDLLTQPCPSIPAAAHCRLFENPGSRVKAPAVSGATEFHRAREAHFTASRSTARWCEQDLIKGNNAVKRPSPVIATYFLMMPKPKAQGEEFWPHGINSIRWAGQSSLLRWKSRLWIKYIESRRSERMDYVHQVLTDTAEDVFKT